MSAEMESPVAVFMLKSYVCVSRRFSPFAFQFQIFWMTWGRAESASTAAPSPRRSGGATARATFSATPAAFTAK